MKLMKQKIIYTGSMVVIAMQFLLGVQITIFCVRRLCFSVAGIDNLEYEYGILLSSSKQAHRKSCGLELFKAKHGRTEKENIRRLKGIKDEGNKMRLR